ncbi:hypothetical protein FHR81_005101 [Actinoalloteichus hoggarensis]|uniref:Uncharacterized protein n=1 Tax=Actinoalloteichus hoggarensis TaxID=1470176 RepID=A0A221WAP1_9PSEU|nr:hypothetical protein [Actinoalloteichus hoggarensis]ASO22834.1 hypothetical protein AHOG_26145 [Actinoalloteichus hoggarensis]MBB5924024.1 hypothetical protein [Actinoalloteichus hoggarensis]
MTEAAPTQEPTADPFGTARLRESVLLAWRSSPTRFREDANSEDDLRFGGYRDRLLIELAQNAADAAAEAGLGGTLRLALTGGELRAANTGSPLSADGVAALSALRASAKRDETSVGRFGVGFAAVLAVSEEPSVISSTGSVAFSAARTAAIVAAEETLADVAAERDHTVPVLRLVWPSEAAEPPPEGFDTEVRLPLRAEIDGAAVLAACVEQAPDLLLALPGLVRIEIEDRTWHREDHADGRVTVHGPDGPRHWLCRRSDGVLAEDELGESGAEARRRRRWSVCWALPVDADGTPEPQAGDRLHAPTPTDDLLSLPARLLATVPLEADRRRARPGVALDAVLDRAAATYAALPAVLVPEQRIAVVPAPGFPRSELDEALRDRLLPALRETAWLPAATGAEVTARDAVVIEDGTAELVELLAEVIPGLLSSTLGAARHTAALSALGVRRLGPAEVVAELSGLRREPEWWRRLYAALLPAAGPGTRLDELGALPVPLVDGRTVTGPRDVLLPDGELAALTATTAVDVTGLRIAHPDAVHPLLETLGARRAGPVELLDSDPVREAVLAGLDEAEAGGDVTPLVELVLGLVARAGEEPRPWLAALPLPAANGELRAADELMLPDAPLASVLDEDAGLGVLDSSVAERTSADVLRRIGVISGFSVLTVESPAGPDHDLADEELWWAEVDGDAEPPAELIAVRDLDLVAAHAWPAALRLLRAEPATWRAVRAPGYTAWWLARYASLAGRPPRQWRLPGAGELAGLYDPVPDAVLAEADVELLVAAGVRTELRITGNADAAELLARLADPESTISVGTALRVHRALADAVAVGLVDAERIEPPDSLRTLTGAVAAADDVVVLDEPWLLAVGDPASCVAVAEPDPFDDAAGDGASGGGGSSAVGGVVPDDLGGFGVTSAQGGAVELAELLDLPFASDEWAGRVVEPGRPIDWAAHVGVAGVIDLMGVRVPDGVLWLHEKLTVRSRDVDRQVPWWVDEDGAVHAADTQDGVARALAWRLDRWSQRQLIAALLVDTTAVNLLA